MPRSPQDIRSPRLPTSAPADSPDQGTAIDLGLAVSVFSTEDEGKLIEIRADGTARTAIVTAARLAPWPTEQ